MNFQLSTAASTSVILVFTFSYTISALSISEDTPLVMKAIVASLCSPTFLNCVQATSNLKLFYGSKT